MSCDSFDLLIVGKSGNGKSATANSIIGQSRFTRQGGSVSELTSPTSGSCVINETQITVVDGLDICLVGQEADFTDVRKALSLCRSGFSALLIVLKFGTRFGKEDVKVVEMIKSIFGPEVLREFGICVLAHGDDFKYAMEDGDETFRNVVEWFQQQTGKVKDLYNECEKRCALFDNMTKNPHERQKQIRDLLNIVENLVQRNKTEYTLNHFQNAEKCRKKLEAMKQYPTLKKETDFLIDKIRKTMSLADDDNKLDTAQLETFVKELETHLTYLNSKLGDDFEHAKHLKVCAKSLVMEIKSKIRNEHKSIDNPPCEYETIDDAVIDEQKAMADTQENCDMDWEILDNTMTIENDISSREHQECVTSVVEKANTTVKNAELQLISTYEQVKSNLVKTLEKTGESNKDKPTIEKAIENIERKLKIFSVDEEERSGIKKMRLSEDKSSAEITIDAVQSKKNSQSDPNEINLLLIGGSGNGKSATANSILGKNAFRITSNTTSVSSPFEKHISRIKEWTVNVVDGPGVDTSKSRHDVLEASLKSLKEILELCDYQFSALLIVLRYGAFLTKHEFEMMNMIRAVLGKDIFSKYGICVVTHGDNFDYDMESAESPVKFQEWYGTHDEKIGQLLKECENRFVLFNNKTADSNVKNEQVEKLISLIKPGQSYSKTEFLSVVGDLSRSIGDTMPKFDQFFENIRHRIEEIETSWKVNCVVHCFELKKILLEVMVYQKMVAVSVGQIKKKIKYLEEGMTIKTTEETTGPFAFESVHYIQNNRSGHASKSPHPSKSSERSNGSGSIALNSQRDSNKRKAEASNPLDIAHSRKASKDEWSEKVRKVIGDINGKLLALKKNPDKVAFSLETIDEDLNEQGRICEIYYRDLPQLKEILEIYNIKHMVAEQKIAEDEKTKHSGGEVEDYREWFQNALLLNPNSV